MEEIKPKRKKYGGRQKGTPNKVPSDVRNMVLESLQKLGGIDYLMEQAKLNPGPYMSLLGKALPKDVKSEISHTGNVSINVMFE